MTYEIAGPAGRLEARWDEPRAASEPDLGIGEIGETGQPGSTGSPGSKTGSPSPRLPRAVAVMAAPDPEQGGTMQDRVVYHATQGLLRSGCAVLRFNYRGVGTSAGAHTGGPGEQDDFRAALNAAAARYPGLPIWAGGYSFGSFVAATVGVADDRVSLLLLFAPPVDIYDFSAIVSSPKPKFLIHGERDELSPLTSVRRFYASLAEPRELVVIDAANHVFDGHASEVAEAVEDLVADFPSPSPPQNEDGTHHG
jgi:alpha/beta superfamily hydrolase